MKIMSNENSFNILAVRKRKNKTITGVAFL